MFIKQKILLIDNYDSFTFNLSHIIKTYSNVDVIRVNNISIDLILKNKYSKIIISPGPGVPQDYPQIFKIIEKFHKTIPFLGICMGHQIIANAFGCELFNLPEVNHGVQKNTKIIADTFLYKNIETNFLSGRYHSWAVSNNNKCKNFIITAVDDDNVIMSIQHKKYMLTGIQYHPESIMTENGNKIIENWIKYNPKKM